jgi:putative ABC transport system permease protein
VQFFLESLVLATVGGILGVGLGSLVTAVAAHAGRNPVSIPLYVPFAGLSAAAAVGILAGLYPAIRAARLAPADALRSA